MEEAQSKLNEFLHEKDTIEKDVAKREEEIHGYESQLK
jgi:hypothetical protein